MTTKVWFFELWRGPIFSNKGTNNLIDCLVPEKTEWAFLISFWNVAYIGR